MHKSVLECRSLLSGALVRVGYLKAANDSPFLFECNVQTIPIFLPPNIYPGFAISSKWWVATHSILAHTAFAFQNLTPIATDPVLGKNVFIGLRRVVRVSPASVTFVSVIEMRSSFRAAHTTEQQNTPALHTAKMAVLVCCDAFQDVNGPNPRT